MNGDEQFGAGRAGSVDYKYSVSSDSMDWRLTILFGSATCAPETAKFRYFYVKGGWEISLELKTKDVVVNLTVLGCCLARESGAYWI
jgi:hypothetical protein